MKVRLKSIFPRFDFWGIPIKRYFPVEILKNPFNLMIQKKNGPFQKSLKKVRGSLLDSNIIDTIYFELFQEGEYQFVFKVYTKKKKALFPILGYILSKHDGGLAKISKNEHYNLRTLHKISPHRVVQPLAGDWLKIELKKRPVRLYGYFTRWISSHHEMGVTRDGRFFINELPFQYFSKQETDKIKGEILNLLFSLYIEEKRIAPEVPLIGAGDIIITRPGSKIYPRLYLIACRKLIKVRDLKSLLLLYLSYKGKWGNKDFYLVPKRARYLQQAIIRSLLKRTNFNLPDIIRTMKTIKTSLPPWVTHDYIKKLGYM